MKRNHQRLLSIFCALLMLFSGMPVGMTAGGESVSINANVSIGQEVYGQITVESGYAALLRVEEDQRVTLSASGMSLCLDIYRGSDTGDRIGGAEGDPLNAVWDANAGSYLLVFSAKDWGVEGSFTLMTGRDTSADPMPVPAEERDAEQENKPTAEPTAEVTDEPSETPTAEPEDDSDTEPTAEPSAEPTAEEIEEPSETPTAEPTDDPETEPTAEPSTESASEETEEPSETPTAEPTDDPGTEPTAEPSAEPTEEESNESPETPTADPAEESDAEPTQESADEPEETPTAEPTGEMTAESTAETTDGPTETPTVEPAEEPTEEPEEKVELLDLGEEDVEVRQLSEEETQQLIADYFTPKAPLKLKARNALMVTSAEEEDSSLPTGTQTTAAQYLALDISLSDDQLEAEEYIVPVTLPSGIALVEDNQTFEGINLEVYHITGEGAVQVELMDIAVSEDDMLTGFTFRTDGFSNYVVKYTVDFHYNGVDYSMPGESQILLSALIENLQIMNGDVLLNVADVEKVEFTDEHLVKVEQVSGLITYNGNENVNVGGKDFLLTSEAPFTTEEILTITLVSGEVIPVGVTDQVLITAAVNWNGYVPGSAVLKLYSDTGRVAPVEVELNGDPDNPPTTITSSGYAYESESWTATFSMPQVDDENNPVRYYVREVSYDSVTLSDDYLAGDYVPIIRGTMESGFTINNTAGSSLPSVSSGGGNGSAKRVKTATNLNEDLESTVTIGFPTEEGAESIDVVFVLDSSSVLKDNYKSLSADIDAMVSSLQALEGAKVRVALVGFNNVAHTLWGLTDVSEIPQGHLETTFETSEVWHWKSNGAGSYNSNMPLYKNGKEGTNAEAGIRAGKAILDGSGTAARNKYLILLTDGATFYYNYGGKSSSTIFYYSDGLRNLGNMDSNGNNPATQTDARVNNSAYSLSGLSFGEFIRRYGNAIEASAEGVSYSKRQISDYYESGNTEGPINSAYRSRTNGIGRVGDITSYVDYPFINMERGTYFAAKALLDVRQAGYQVISVGYPYKPYLRNWK